MHESKEDCVSCSQEWEMSYLSQCSNCKEYVCDDCSDYNNQGDLMCPACLEEYMENNND